MLLFRRRRLVGSVLLLRNTDANPAAAMLLHGRPKPRGVAPSHAPSEPLTQDRGPADRARVATGRSTGLTV